MNQTELIGKVGARYLKEALVHDDEDTAIFLIDCLSAEETAAIATAILDDAILAPLVDIKLPGHYVKGLGLPEHILTEERATFHRNAHSNKPAQLLCSIGDDETQSLNAITAIGVQQLFGHPLLWVKTVSENEIHPEDYLKRWSRALQGLMDLNFRSLGLTARYVIDTYNYIHREGEPLVDALGLALPALKIPKCRNQFLSIRPDHQMHVSRWKKLFETANKKKACYLSKQNTTQLLLSEQDLANTFTKVKDEINEEYYEIIENFIKAPTGWNDQAIALSKCEWNDIESLFSGLRRQKLDLGQTTLKFYADAKPDHLTEAEKEYLERLGKSKRKQAEDDDKAFFDLHRNEIKEERKLKSHWDRFIYGTARVCEDFAGGLLLVMETLLNRALEGKKRHLKIICEYRSKRGFRSLNADAGYFFAKRYNGLEDLLKGCVSFEVGPLFKFSELIKEWQKNDVKKNRSQSKTALCLKFTIELEVNNQSDNIDQFSTQLEWKFNPNTVNSEFASDMERLANHPLVFCSANRESVSSKGHYQPLNLANVHSFAPVFGKKRGSFVAVYQSKNNLADYWFSNLEQAELKGYVAKETVPALKEAFEAFKESYSIAIKGFVAKGLVEEHLLIQYEKYADLLELICSQAKGDFNRQLLLRPLLEIGAVKIGGGQTATLVSPWHPLRLAAIAIKARHATGLIKYLLGKEDIEFGDTGTLFFRDLQEVLAHPFYPEIVIGWDQAEPSLLTLTDSVGDYSLHERPLARKDQQPDDIHDNPKEGAAQVSKMVSRYLELHPHEQANLSVILYNCDTATLPQAVVEKIRSLHEDDEELLCQVILRHRDSRKLRELYEKIIEGADETADSFNASEETQDFMARLRIGIMADEAAAPHSDENRPEDLVFLQDVISRHAEIEWCEEDADPIGIDKLFPSRWARRRPTTRNDLKSEVYLCCPAQTREGWAFLTAVTSFIKGDWNGKKERRLLPARQLNFSNNEIKKIFDETHSLGNWVVNYDELLDRRQLVNQGVQIIRYKQTATQGRNLIISSKAPMGLLKSMVQVRIEGLGLGLAQCKRHDLADRFIKDANEVSGDLVLRAAKRGRSANELMGVVLSRFLIRQEIGLDCSMGVFFLDDYAEWLGKKEQQIADLLVLCPSQEGNHFHLKVIITEAKYIQFESLSAKRKESQNQLRDTIRRIGDALFGSPKRLDRSLWLARLSDLLLDGIDIKPGDHVDLSACRRAIRDGFCTISLRGYAHVFVNIANTEQDCSDFARVSNCEHDAYMEVFSPQILREIVLAYAHDENPLGIRRHNADEDIWSGEMTARMVTTVVNPAQEDVNSPETVVLSKRNRPDSAEVKQAVKESEASSKLAEESLTVTDHNWAYPGLGTYFQNYNNQEEDSEEEQAWLADTERKFRMALQEFQLKSKLRERVLTPNAAILKYEGSNNLTVDQVQKRQLQFLTTHGLDIIAVRPEPGMVSVAIKRPNRRVLRTVNIWKSWTPDVSSGNHTLLIAVREENGAPLFFSPKNNAPHTLIAGETGSGKSVLMQNIILGIACTNTPRQAKITLIDPKGGVDYFALENIPHLSAGIIDECEAATLVLDGLIIEMEARYKQLKENRVSNIFELNAKVPPEDAIPIHWVIHDEFAEWMMIDEYKKAVSKTVSRLSTKARAAGIFLIFAAQRPDKDAMPMQLRANLGNRLILKVADEGTSEIGLAMKAGGADKLLGRGHLAAKLQNEDKELILAQVPLVENHELEALVKLMNRQDEPK